MTVAELFVNLGIKGNLKVGEALTKVHTSLGDVGKMSLEAKAGILGALYGLERLTASATGMAADLRNFALATGLSTNELQKWNYVATANGVTADEMAGTLKNLQKITVDMMLGKGIPEGFMLLGIRPSRNPFEMLTQIQTKIKTFPVDVARNLAAGLGISDKMFAMLRSNRASLSDFKSAFILSPDQIDRLDRLNTKWALFWETFKTGFAMRLSDSAISKPLTSLVEGLRNAIYEGITLFGKFDKAIGHFAGPKTEAAFKVLALGLAAALAPISPLLAGLTALVAILDDIYKYTHGKESLIGNLVNNGKAIGDIVGNFVSPPKETDFLTGPLKEKRERELYSEGLKTMLTLGLNKAFSTNNGAQDQSGTNVTQHTTIHVHGNMDKDAANEVIKQKDISNAYFQNSALNNKR